jgi:hypothetical protein
VASGGFTFTNFVADAFAVFMFILWFWLLITVSSDLFRRHDVSGLGKVLWVILLIVLPSIGIFAYIFTQGPGMAERNEARAKEFFPFSTVLVALTEHSRSLLWVLRQCLSLNSAYAFSSWMGAFSMRT